MTSKIFGLLIFSYVTSTGDDGFAYGQTEEQARHSIEEVLYPGETIAHWASAGVQDIVKVVHADEPFIVIEPVESDRDV